MTDPRLIKDIQGSEGCKLLAYWDPIGDVYTIGWGHELPGPAAGLTWTQGKADQQLDIDINLAQAFAVTLVEWPSLDTDCRRNAVIELCFNMRRRWLLFAKTRAAITKQDWQAAHDGLLASLWEKQVGRERADRLADYLLTGAYP